MMDDAGLSSLIGQIYAAAHDGTSTPAMLNSLADALNAHQAVSVFYDAATHATTAVAPRQDPDYMRNYSEYWAPRNFIRQRSVGSPVGELITIPMFASQNELEQSDFFNEWLRPQGMDGVLAANITAEGSASTLVGVFRPLRLGEFNEHERNLFSLLLPHLRRAALYRHMSASLELTQASAVEALDRLHVAVVVVDAAAKVLFANRVAEMLLSKANNLRTDGNRLSAATLDATRRLRVAIADCASNVATRGGRQVTLPRADRPPIDGLVIPFPAIGCRLGATEPAAILVATDPGHQKADQVASLRRSFRLTPAEAALAIEIFRGEGRQAAAARLGISLSTVRTHLTSIFEKTDTHRQAELVRLIYQVCDHQTSVS